MDLDPPSVLTLKELCLVKIAIAINNDPEVKTFSHLNECSVKKSNNWYLSWFPESCFKWEEQSIFPYAHVQRLAAEGQEILNMDANQCDCLRYYTSEFHKDRFFNTKFSNCYVSYWKWKTLIVEKASIPLLSDSLEKDLLSFVRHISVEVMKWEETHSNILHGASELHSYFHWKSQGIINKEETAKSLIRNEQLSLRERYALASFYCFKDEALDLWNKLTWGEKYLANHDYPCLTVWNNWMKGKKIDWDSLADKRLWVPEEKLPKKILWKFYFHLGVRTVFPKLSDEKKLEWLKNSLKGDVIDYEEFYFCLSLMDAHEKENIIKEYAFHVLVYFLDLPLLGQFLEVADHLWSYLSGRMFFLVLHFIIYEKIVKEWSEFNYFQLLQKFWYASPIHLKEYIQTKVFLEVVLMAIDCPNKSSFLSEQIVLYCEQFDYAHHFREETRD